MKKQRQYLETAQDALGVGPTKMAQILNTNFNTYKAWLYEENPMPGVASAYVDMLLGCAKCRKAALKK